MNATSASAVARHVRDAPTDAIMVPVTFTFRSSHGAQAASGEDELVVETSLLVDYESNTSASSASSNGSKKRTRAVLDDDEPEVYRPLKRCLSEEETARLEREVDELRETVLEPYARLHGIIPPVRSRAPSPEAFGRQHGYVPSPPWSCAASPSPVKETVAVRRSQRLVRSRERARQAAPPVAAPKNTAPKAPRMKAAAPKVPKAPATIKRKPTKTTKRKTSRRA